MPELLEEHDDVVAVLEHLVAGQRLLTECVETLAGAVGDLLGAEPPVDGIPGVDLDGRDGLRRESAHVAARAVRLVARSRELLADAEDLQQRCAPSPTASAGD